MKLFFHGATYNHDAPAVEVNEGEVAGKYRGAFWRFHRTSVNVAPHEAADLKYRGATYRH